jgi:hypothetical protein
MGNVKFLSDWSHEQDGEIRPGEPLTIEYAGERLARCRARRYGQDTWGIAAYLRFHPSGAEQQGQVAPTPLTVQVPVGATQIEVWFHNTDSTGCSTWDSRYGQNYWFDVTRTSS